MNNNEADFDNTSLGIIYLLLAQTYLRFVHHYCLRCILRFFGPPQMDKEIPKKNNLHESAMRDSDNREILKTRLTETVQWSNMGTI